MLKTSDYIEMSYFLIFCFNQPLYFLSKCSMLIVSVHFQSTKFYHLDGIESFPLYPRKAIKAKLIFVRYTVGMRFLLSLFYWLYAHIWSVYFYIWYIKPIKNNSHQLPFFFLYPDLMLLLFTLFGFSIFIVVIITY